MIGQHTCVILDLEIVARSGEITSKSGKIDQIKLTELMCTSNMVTTSLPILVPVWILSELLQGVFPCCRQRLMGLYFVLSSTRNINLSPNLSEVGASISPATGKLKIAHEFMLILKMMFCCYTKKTDLCFQQFIKGNTQW